MFEPEFRSRYQCWLFSYPTGNPPAYSAMRLRQELASIERSYPHSRPYVFIGHSMGGLLSQMQVTTVNRNSWNVLGKDKAETFFAKVKPGDIIDQSTRFHANPHVGRVIFICTPTAAARSPSASFRDHMVPVNCPQPSPKSAVSSICISNRTKGTCAFFFNQRGLMGGLGLEGSKINPHSTATLSDSLFKRGIQRGTRGG